MRNLTIRSIQLWSYKYVTLEIHLLLHKAYATWVLHAYNTSVLLLFSSAYLREILHSNPMGICFRSPWGSLSSATQNLTGQRVAGWKHSSVLAAGGHTDNSVHVCSLRKNVSPLFWEAVSEVPYWKAAGSSVKRSAVFTEIKCRMPSLPLAPDRPLLSHIPCVKEEQPDTGKNTDCIFLCSSTGIILPSFSYFSF